MPAFTLELLQPSSTSYQDQQSLDIEFVGHIHSRIDTFRYLKKLHDSNIGLTHINDNSLNSESCLGIFDRTDSISSNSYYMLSERSPYKTVYGNSYASRGDEVLATSKVIKDLSGNLVPCWYKINLPEGIANVHIQTKTNIVKGLRNLEYEIDYDNNCIWTNKTNYYNHRTGQYEIFFITGSGSNGSIREIASFSKAVPKATWEDLDSETGKLDSTKSTYTVVSRGSEYNILFSQTALYYIKSEYVNLIKPLAPLGYYASENWYLRFSKGFIIGGKYKSNRYTIPEYEYQSFAPYKPYKWSAYKQIYTLGRRILKIQEDSILYAENSGLHVELFFYDPDGTLKRVLTTNSSLDGKYYGNTLVKYNYGDIINISKQGYIYLNVDIDPTYTVSASYYAKLDTFEFTKINLNPLLNPKVIDNIVVIYCIPGVGATEEALHYILVDRNGMIIDTSQDSSTSYPSLKLKTSESFNEDTAIGLGYQEFLNQYSSYYDNDYQYLILAEISAGNRYNKDLLVTDIIEPYVLDVPKLVEKNERLNYSYPIQGTGRKEVQEKLSLVVEAPLSLLLDYGGKFSQRDAELLLTKYLPAGVYPIIKWISTIHEVGISDITDQMISFTISAGIKYRLYSLVDNSYVLVDEFDSSGSYDYNNLDSNTIYKLEFRPVIQNVEYPADYQFSIRTRK